MNTRRQTRSSTKASIEAESKTNTGSADIKQEPEVKNESPEEEPKQKAKETKKRKPKAERSKKGEEKPIDDDGAREQEDEVNFQLSEREMKEVNNAFDLNCSEDGEELLDSDDLKTAIRALGFEPRVHEIRKLLKKFANKNGKVNRDGFHKIMASKMGNSAGLNDNVTSNDEISKVFNLLDLDKTGLITLENLKSIARELNEEIADEELQEMIGEADLDGDFKINKLEFQNIMKKTSLY